ncbi:hypothetical protein IWX90DRAFT_182149 [Phyllosticta citrichinensis]|uniref:Uncharacterized protein n=1 Tax=Phyllosticta citrichinensis TaxID=1130410 RepID=A0ABR1XVW5_9PEZI
MSATPCSIGTDSLCCPAHRCQFGRWSPLDWVSSFPGPPCRLNACPLKHKSGPPRRQRRRRRRLPSVTSTRPVAPSPAAKHDMFAMTHPLLLQPSLCALCCYHGRLSSATRNCKTPRPPCGPKQPPPPSPPYPSSLAHRRTWDCRLSDLSRSRSEPTNQKQNPCSDASTHCCCCCCCCVSPPSLPSQKQTPTHWLHTCLPLANPSSPSPHPLASLRRRCRRRRPLVGPLPTHPYPVHPTPSSRLAVRSSLCLLRSTKYLLPPSNFPTRQRAAARLTPDRRARTFVAHHQKTPLSAGCR